MKPLREWTQRSRNVLVLAIIAVCVAGFALAATTDTGPTEAETARYQRVRTECTAAVDNLGLVGRQRVESINDCLKNRY